MFLSTKDRLLKLMRKEARKRQKLMAVSAQEAFSTTSHDFIASLRQEAYKHRTEIIPPSK